MNEAPAPTVRLARGRTDIHRPGVVDPAGYEWVGCFYQGTSRAFEISYMRAHAELARGLRDLGNPPAFQGNFETRASCDLCGARFAHGDVFFHAASGETISVGWICATDHLALPDRAAREHRLIEREGRAEAERIRRQEETAGWREENADVVEWLMEQLAEGGRWSDWNDAHYEDERPGRNPHRALHPFLHDMVHTINRYGNLSGNQLAATRRWMERDAERQVAAAEREPEVEPTEALREGRREIEGEILSTKWQDSMYGGAMKMLVREDDGNKVWGTIPQSLMTYGEDGSEWPARGTRVAFTAQVERSRDDEHFGFFKRPTAARLVETVAA